MDGLVRLIEGWLGASGMLSSFLVSVAAIAIVVAAALVLHRLMLGVLRRIVARTRGVLDEILLRDLRRPSRLLLVGAAVITVLPALPVEPDTRALLTRLTVLATTAFIGWMMIAVARSARDYINAHFDIHVANNLRARQVRTRTAVLYRVAAIVILIITACLMLMSLPSVRQIGLTLFASAGLAGLAVGAAAQPALKNLIAGVQLAFTEPIRIDDVVIIEGEWGRIEEIRLTYVVVRIWDERRLIVPVSRFLEAPFQNWTRSTSEILGTAFFHLDFTVPVERLREKLQEIAGQSNHWDGKVCVLQVTDLKERTMEIRALVSADDAGAAFDLRCEVREKMVAFINENFPQTLPQLRAHVVDQQSCSGGAMSGAGLRTT